MAGKHPRIAPEMTERARQLRREMTGPEKLVWSRLKGQQLLGLRFRKQHPIGPFIVDFYCASLSLVVEIDGMSHTDLQADAARQKRLEEGGTTVLRYTNDDVIEDLDSVINDLAGRAAKLMGKHPPVALNNSPLDPP
jgi:very-short-patch-repair endonuclease